MQAARTPTQLAVAAAEGTARLTGTAAAAFVIDQDGELHSGLDHGEDRAAAPPDAGAHDAVARLLSRIGQARTGEHGTVVPAPLWPPGFFRPGDPDDARLVLGLAPDGRPQVCLALPAGPVAPATEALLDRLARATALAAEPLLMYRMERQVALTLQRSFLPRRQPELPGVDVAVRYVPASRRTEIGGDFHVALGTADGILAGVGDVVGHSLDAAAVMVEIRHALRAYCVEDTDPGRLVARLDRMLRHYHPDATATVCLTLVEPVTGRTRIANAGHIPPLVLRAGGGTHYVEGAGPLLGLGLDRPPPVETVLKPGDRLLMITDGLIETRGTDLMDSLDHLRTAAAEAPPEVAGLCDALLDHFGRDRDDDIALLALRVLELRAVP